MSLRKMPFFPPCRDAVVVAAGSRARVAEGRREQNQIPLSFAACACPLVSQARAALLRVRDPSPEKRGKQIYSGKGEEMERGPPPV